MHIKAEKVEGVQGKVHWDRVRIRMHRYPQHYLDLRIQTGVDFFFCLAGKKDSSRRFPGRIRVVSADRPNTFFTLWEFFSPHP